MANLLSKRIHDRRLIKLYWKLVNAGYVNDGEYEDSDIGVPQGGVLSPLLSNIYLHEFDEYMERVISKYSNNKRASKANPQYLKLKRQIKNLENVKRKELSQED